MFWSICSPTDLNAGETIEISVFWCIMRPVLVSTVRTFLDMTEYWKWTGRYWCIWHWNVPFVENHTAVVLTQTSPSQTAFSNQDQTILPKLSLLFPVTSEWSAPPTSFPFQYFLRGYFHIFTRPQTLFVACAHNAHLFTSTDQHTGSVEVFQTVQTRTSSRIHKHGKCSNS